MVTLTEHHMTDLAQDRTPVRARDGDGHETETDMRRARDRPSPPGALPNAALVVVQKPLHLQNCTGNVQFSGAPPGAPETTRKQIV